MDGESKTRTYNLGRSHAITLHDGDLVRIHGDECVVKLSEHAKNATIIVTHAGTPPSRHRTDYDVGTTDST
jgi:hypothetical protein